jgi:hypothetical protein
MSKHCANGSLMSCCSSIQLMSGSCRGLAEFSGKKLRAIHKGDFVPPKVEGRARTGGRKAECRSSRPRFNPCLPIYAYDFKSA